MFLRLVIIILAAFCCFSCRQEKSYVEQNRVIKYDIFPVIGQSNAYFGMGLDPLLDKTDSRIKQLGRHGNHNYQIIPAKDPLEHFSVAPDRNGFAMTFAFNYIRNYWRADREVLLIPAALDGSSFSGYQWRKGDTLYNDVVRRIKYVLEKFPGSEVKAFLWHQGETDISWGRYYAFLLDKMITDMRRDVAGNNGDSIPFILGGFVPYWADQRADRKKTDSVIAETPTRLPFIGHASARDPFIIEKPVNTIDDIHFDAEGQRELGVRYFREFQKIKN
ncbi:sialate O-acetylesterase [Lacibacter sp. H375]|uniref:sialate O-acetylesterase n=1 Tax=Lacibacter sp. H375 TaxID=3133424 RepID=UPI0030C2139C